MVGILVACVAALCFWLADNSREEIFRKSASVLFWWYVVTSVLVALVVGSVLVLGVFAGGLTGLASDSAEVLAVGGAIGGVAGFLVLALVVAFFRAFSIVGAHLLRTAVAKDNEGNYKWRRKRVVAGSVFVAIPVILDVAGRLLAG